MKLTSHLHLLPTLGTSGAVPLMPLYAFECTHGQLTHFTFSILLIEEPSVSPLMLRLF